jgi:hypothetical protein
MTPSLPAHLSRLAKGPRASPALLDVSSAGVNSRINLRIVDLVSRTDRNLTINIQPVSPSLTIFIRHLLVQNTLFDNGPLQISERYRLGRGAV